MKTVMKKLFSLMLVAALLVSVVPTAFADGECEHTNKTAVSAVDATCTTPGNTAGARCNDCGEFVDGATEIAIDSNAHDWAVATCDAPKTCKRCGATEGETLPHNYTGATCTENAKCSDCGAEKPDSALGHDYGTDGNDRCSRCNKCPSCGLYGNNQHADDCTLTCTGAYNCPSQKGHKAGCQSLISCEYCGKASTAGHDANCKALCTVDENCPNAPGDANHKALCPKNPCTTQYCTLPNNHTGDHVIAKCGAGNGQCTHDKGHDGKHSYQCTKTAGCQLVVGHTGTCSDTPEPAAPGKSTLKVFVNLYTADVKTKTYELTRYTDLSSKTKVYPFISNRIDELKSLLPNGYTWSGNVYDADNDDNAELMNKTVGSGRTVYINAYTGQDYVYIYVHNSRSYSNIRVIQLDGKKVGDNVSRSEVWKAVSKYYSLNSLKMFDEDGWEAYVKNDKTAQDVESLTVDSNIYEIHVRISGSSKSSGSTADSSNPKTGDAIFVPVMVLGVSASALAVLFYLNKKRAF